MYQNSWMSGNKFKIATSKKMTNILIVTKIHASQTLAAQFLHRNELL